VPEATERLRKAVELYRRVFPKDRYPHGHSKLAEGVNDLGFLILAQGDAVRAEPLYREALAMRQVLYPKEKYPQGHVEVAQSLNNLGYLVGAKGDHVEAEKWYRQALAMKRALYPKEKYPDGHADLALGLNSLGQAIQVQGEHARAEPLQLEALAMHRRLFPKAQFPAGHPDLAIDLNNLGLLYQAQGEYAKAEPMYREALAMRQALFPKEKFPRGHPDLAQALNNMAYFLEGQGDYVRAEPLYREALEMRRRLYPREKYPQGHRDLAISIFNLGKLLDLEGEYGKAVTLQREALTMRRACFPEDKYPRGHRELADSLGSLSSALRALGEYARAEPMLLEALAMNRRLYPGQEYPHGHAELANSLNSLAVFYQDRRELTKAEPLYREALEMSKSLYSKEAYPKGHPGLAHAFQTLASVLMAQGDSRQAEPYLRDALAILVQLFPRQQYPDGHPQLAHALHTLGLVHGGLGEDARAESRFREALAMRQALYPRDRFPAGHPEVANSLAALAFFFADRGKYVQGEPFLRQSLAMYTQLAGHLAEVAPEAVALNMVATFPLMRDTLLASTSHLPGSEERTYDAVWHSRAALTRVYQRRHLALIAAATDDAIRKAWDELQTLRREREQLIMAPVRATASGRADKFRADKLGEVNRQIVNAELALLPKLPALKHCDDLARLGPDALQKLLPADAVLVDVLRYVHVEPDPRQPGGKGEKSTVRYLAFVVSRQAIQRVDLGTAATIEPAVRAWRAAITAQVPAGNDTARAEHEAQLGRQASTLRSVIWEPLEKHLPAATRVVHLAPEGELTQLPWAALPGKGKDRVLLEDYALAVVPHSPFVLEQMTPLPRSAQRPPATGLLLVGGIRYDERPHADSSTLLASNRAADEVVEHKLVWNYLKGTQVERTLLASLVGKAGHRVTANLGESEAATARLRSELELCRYAHIATHGFFADAKLRSIVQLDPELFRRTTLDSGDIGQRIGEGARSPLVLSGLVCAGANLPGTPERGILSADAIAGLLLDDLHLAVLSACDTGIGDVAGGEGVFGLQRAFHIAGCKNVIASLWKVDDAATAALMVRFYSHLFAEDQARRLSPIEALRRAQLELYRHPELIPTWAKGETRGPGLPRPATTPAPADTPRDLVTTDGRAPTRLWAAFTLSGLGR
jgi:CHAT domain-containing protein/tetratricopeptide (TPR) repeat protein